MSREQRIKEYRSKITAFEKESYTKAECLEEYLTLQNQIVQLVFGEEDAKNENLQLWDVDRHLKALNREKGYPLGDELTKFGKETLEIAKAISAEISGNRGEWLVFSTLDDLKCRHTVLRNVEFEVEGNRTEIDALVFTSKAIFMIEVKNSRKDIYINENGDYYRTGRSGMIYDGNIGDKMDERRLLLLKALKDTGVYEPKVFKMVVFTNTAMSVNNKYRYLKTCYVDQIVDFIDNFESRAFYSPNDIQKMVDAVEDFRCKNAYKISVDMEEYKAEFANILATLEGEVEEPSETVETLTDMSIGIKTNTFDDVKSDNTEDQEIIYTFNIKKGLAIIGASALVAGLGILGSMLLRD